jgi:hypothetical protein
MNERTIAVMKMLGAIVPTAEPAEPAEPPAAADAQDAPATETGPEPSLLHDRLFRPSANQAATARLFGGVIGAPEPEPAPPRRGGFDGGARRPLPPRPPTHEETLLRVLAERRADVGRFFGV